MRHLLALLFVIVTLNCHTQTNMHDIGSDDFLGICRILSDVPEICKPSNMVEFQGDSILFVLLNFSDSINYGNGLSLNQSLCRMKIWYIRDLFFYDIPYYFEVESVGCENRLITATVISRNSINVENRKPTFKVELVIKKNENKYELQNYTYSYLLE